ncbi:uncharacterized protein J7T54_002028 [Emericellopsis cladophorae]|uniref:rRNA biogenesis protein RRP36 n=1 Tax=Emericellopsis cladophorae TaxID=2686198 RepID=A0A9Q0BG12_9HYPO|nr:uncharacterized protein J7T54_002028 [Emericellopsis cladophorae]KAI6782869.1 hypothetical protein J7T54_002028 [Emericellopsis cladophorae]
MPPKRKAQSIGIERRVRLRREEELVPEAQEEAQSDGPESSESDADENATAAQRNSESGSESEEDEPEPGASLASISFGALARAQASQPSAGRSKKGNSDNEDEDQRPAEHKRPTFKSAKDLKRSSKHAPQEQTSKRPVSRFREIITENKRAPARDPRFDTMSSGRMDEAKAAKAYAFLDEYRDSELADLKVQLKKTKDPDEKEDLKRQIMSMESRRKARKKKQEEEQLLVEHRKREKDLVAQGKTPFYLKKSEQKKQVLTKRFEGMSKGQVDKAIERKRKKVAGKEKKELDFMQRRG